MQCRYDLGAHCVKKLNLVTAKGFSKGVIRECRELTHREKDILKRYSSLLVDADTENALLLGRGKN